MPPKDSQGSVALSWRILFSIMAITWLWALLFQLIFSIDPTPQGDPTTFDWLACNLLDTGKLIEPHIGYRSWRAPGYPTFVAGVYALLGRNPNFVIVTQYGLLGVLNLFLFATSYRIWNNLKGSYLLFAFSLSYFPLFYFASMLFAETLFLTLVSGAIWATVLIMQQHQNRWLKSIITGTLFGLAILTRTALLYFPVFGLGMLLVFVMTSRFFKYPIQPPTYFIKKVIGIGLGILVIVSPWTIRNYVVHGHFLLTGSYGGYNLYMTQYPLLKYPHWPGNIPATLWPEISHNITVVQEKYNEVAQDRVLSQMAIDIIKKHPFRFIEKGVLEFIRFYSKAGVYGQGILRYLSFLQYTSLVLLSIWGLFLTRKNIFSLILGTYMLYFGLIHSITFAMGRLKEALVPALLILASIGCLDLCLRIYKRWKRSS